jgi:chloramphenicol-sensitive protein RarD
MTRPLSDAEAPKRSRRQQGVVFGLCAYFLWGLFPLYWPLLKPAGPIEILACRVVFSLLFVLVILVVTRNWSWVRPVLRDKRRMGLLAVASVLIAINWGVYIYAVNSGQVVQGSLGYFANPLVTIGIGVIVLHERLRKMQWVAVALGAGALAILTFAFGGVPWIALVLAFSFAFYGLTKKTVNMGSVESLAVETAILFLPMLACLVGIELSGRGSLFNHTPAHFALLASTGIATAVPLLFFGGAATRVPLSWIGIMQYLGPVMQFLIGVLVLHEPMSPGRWVGFSLVWIALAILTTDSLLAIRRGRADRADTTLDAVVGDAAEAH